MILNNKYYRVPGLIFIASSLMYLIWLLTHLNPSALGLGLLFFISQAFIFLTASISVVNHWYMKFRTDRPIVPSNPPPVAVIIPTYKEPVEILKKTVESVLKIKYKGEVVVVVSNDYKRKPHAKKIETMIQSVSKNLNSNMTLHLIHTTHHRGAKAGNLNQVVSFLRHNYTQIDLVLTQDADETVKPDILNAIVGYFTQSTKVAFVQTIKDSITHEEDPFGNKDYMWYMRTAASREANGSMFACGSAVIWRLSCVESVGGFSTWNLVEDLTTSYNLLAEGWESRYHFENLSEGLAPEDLANFFKQRGTWALDNLRLFFWDNPSLKKGLSVKQKLGFLEQSFFYLNGLFLVLLLSTTSISLIFEIWPTTANATEHALALVPSFIALEAYFLLLAGGLPQKRIRQFWIGLSPLFITSTFKALFYGPNKKPQYVVTAKSDSYKNYIKLVTPHLILMGILGLGIAKTIFSTKIYSSFDWAVFFWGLYQMSFFYQVLRVSVWKWRPQFNPKYSLSWPFGAQTKVSLSYTPDSL